MVYTPTLTMPLLTKVRLREAGAGDRRKLLQAVRESVESLGVNVQAFAKGLSSLELDSGAGEALDKALVKGPCADLWGAMLRSEALHAGHDLPAAEPSDATERKKAQAALLASLKPKAKAALEALEKGLSAKGGGVEGFCEALWKVSQPASQPASQSVRQSASQSVRQSASQSVRQSVSPSVRGKAPRARLARYPWPCLLTCLLTYLLTSVEGGGDPR
jgi:hypothetical protein